jgi:acetyl-CoA acetyltransferase
LQPKQFRKKSAVVGIGTTKFGSNTGSSPFIMAARALKEALFDAGLSKDQLDGLIMNTGPPHGVDYDVFARGTGLNIRFASQTKAHGRFSGSILQHAAMAVTMGLARFVACIGVARWYTTLKPDYGNPKEEWNELHGPHLEMPMIGMASFAASAALATSRYFHKYKVSSEELGEVVVASREHASLNPNALKRKKISLEHYAGAKFVVEPLRIYDFFTFVDGACCMIVASEDDARSFGKKNPIYISGYQGLNAGREDYSFANPGGAIGTQGDFDFRPSKRDLQVYEMSGVKQSEIDMASIYDAFSIQVLFGLERFGFCTAGEAGRWIQGGRIRIGGELPLNTSGGHLSEGHLYGWNHMVEAVRQARGECGKRQVKRASITQYIGSHGDSIIFRRI